MEQEHLADEFIHQALKVFMDSATVTGGYSVFKIDTLDHKSGWVSRGDFILKQGRQVCSYIKGSTQFALFLCMAGEILTLRSADLNAKAEFMEAFIVDAIGSMTVENAMDKIQEELRLSMHFQSLNTSNRYSPGYCHWELSDQKALFHMIGNQPTGITLSESCLILPSKSVIGLIGIGHALKHKEYGCKICKMDNCIYRKVIL